ncbi:prim-pol domain-containing protein [Aureobasidium pullulans]|uniref:DNA primase n=1 Tax=Aureobasidium pullulans TaxID=5580 RepID=A0AB74IR03_AURPU|nr:prim-pol domain-containing protein [Aureobasidium pullulans]
MPHAESPNPPSSPPVEDTVMSEAAPGALDEQAESQNETTQSSPAPAVNEVEKASLEDIFDDDDMDDDDEFSSSAQVKPQPSSQPEPKPGNSNVGKDAEVLRAFYQRLFPFKYLFQWLNHSPTTTTDFSNRELAFVLPNDAYIRYQSFNTAEDLRKQCIQLTPTRFEIGPVYSANPRDRKTLRNASAFRPLAKELVFDIDMTDYDEIRTCCSGASICQKCWQFITMAIKVIDKALRDDFGFKHIMWVYSGRRGAHAWISDKRAREMDDNKRRSIAGYLELLKGGDKTGKKVNLKRPLHPHIDRSLKILNGYFQTDVLLEQDPWASPGKAAHLLQLLPDKNLTAALQRKWDSTPHRSSTQKWADIDAVASVSGSLSSLTPETLVHAKQDIRLEYTYPRLDAEVSKKLNHLLKSPFVIHPGTGRVCVPIDIRRFEDFEPEKVPTVQQLLSEIDSWQGNDDKVQDWQKTSLKPYIELFRDHVNAIMKDERAAEKRGREESGEGVDF